MVSRVASMMVYFPIIGMVACSGEGKANEDVQETNEVLSDEPTDVKPEICVAHPDTCWTGSGPEGPFDCCRSPKKCCDLCLSPGSCGSQTMCLEVCPEIVPCEGIPMGGYMSCYYEPSAFSGSVYCPVPSNPSPHSVACVSECSTGVECPFPEGYDNVYLCCPEGRSCGMVEGYELPFCSEE